MTSDIRKEINEALAHAYGDGCDTRDASSYILNAIHFAGYEIVPGWSDNNKSLRAEIANLEAKMKDDGRFDVNDYRTLCEGCWKGDTAEEAEDRGKEQRVRTKHIAGHKPKGRGFQNSKDGLYKTRLTSDGPKTVRR